MPRRYHAQRKHIIHALDALSYQLFCLSFYLSPSLLNILFRIAAQLICTTTRDFSPKLSLGGFFFFPLFSNSFSLWNHLSGPTEGRAVILDFVGLAYTPSKFQLLFVDFSIILLQLLLTVISFEMHTPEGNTEDSPDYLLPTPTSPIPSFPTFTDHKAFESPNNEPRYILDIRLSYIIARLWRAPPMSRTSTQDTLIPFPNTTSWPVPMSLIMRTAGRRRRDTERNAGTRDSGQDNRRIPGGIDTENMD
ncbi:hypothetical protein D9757_000625 [Collybiopsis confluens]|uniref:DUF1746 domain-containing protein n=1 Tax=Collybiopsis confluens TaxID=2823264 RepID=A0A8H5MGJ2_9AGAR|nr:hypothetical protein D9757_000625 [Collybiopsis confluens]